MIIGAGGGSIWPTRIARTVVERVKTGCVVREMNKLRIVFDELDRFHVE